MNNPQDSDIYQVAVEKQLAYEKIKLLFDNAPLICVGTAITYLAMAALFWNSGSHLLLLLWLASMATVLLVE